MRWKWMSKALRFLQIIITPKHQNCPFFFVFLPWKTLSQNISTTLLQISLKLHEYRGGYWRKKLPLTILKEKFRVPRNTVSFRCYDNSNVIVTLIITKFLSLSDTTLVAICPNLCLWRRSLCSNLGGIDPEKLYRATLTRSIRGSTKSFSSCQRRKCWGKVTENVDEGQVS